MPFKFALRYKCWQVFLDGLIEKAFMWFMALIVESGSVDACVYGHESPGLSLNALRAKSIYHFYQTIDRARKRMG